MIAYYLDNSIHEIPAVIHIARVLGGLVLTDGPGTYAVLRAQYGDVAVEFYPSLAGLRQRLEELRPATVIHADRTRPVLNLGFETAHIQVFHGISDKTYSTSPKNREYDFYLVSGERRRQVLAKAGILRPGNYAMVGYPKVDRVFRGELPKEAAAKKLGLDPGCRTILYAPTWRDFKANSSLSRFGVEVVSSAPDEYNLLVKLHPNTKRYDHRFYPLIEQLADARRNIKLIGYEHDIIPVMAAADLLIADISSVAHEFLCFDRPYVFLDPRLLRLGKKKTWIWQCGQVVTRRGRVWETVAEALAEPGRYAAQRAAAREAVFYMTDGRAAERAAEAIRSFLGTRVGSS